MTRIFTEGFEIGDVLFFNGLNGNIGTTYARSGTYAVRCHDGTYKTIAPLSEFYHRVAIYPLVWGGGGTNAIAWYSDGTKLGHIAIDAVTHVPNIYVNNVKVANGSIPIPALFQWYVFEVHIKIADSPNGLIEVRVDGVSNGSYSGDTKPGSQTTINNVRWSGFNGYDWIDDLALNDTTGTVDNSWCGDGHIIALFPNANGDVSQLVGSDGNSTDNYLLVDEKPLDNDTTYVEGSVVDERDLYNVEAFTPTNVTINRVWVESRSRDTVASGVGINLGIKPSGGSETYNATDFVLLTSYTNFVTSGWLLNPADNQPFEASDLSDIQVAIKTR